MDYEGEPWLKGSGTEEDPYKIKNLVIDAGGNFFCMLIMNSEAYFRIMDCTFSNTGPYNSQDGRNAALILVSTQNGVIFKNELFGCGIPGARLGGGIALVASSNNKVQKNFCHDNELSGIYVQSSNDNIMRQNLCTGNTYGIFILEWSNNNEITKNECYDNEDHGILLWSESNGNLVTKNDVKGSLIGGITASGSHGNVITDNHCSENQFGIILAEWSTYNEVTNNDCSNNKENGIHLWFNANYNEISENICKENPVTGIVVGTSNGNIIIDNICIENDGSGIAVVDWYGLNSVNNILCRNTLENNFYGIFFNNVDNNDVFRNLIEENYYGIYLEGACELNIIYHNNIINNLIQASSLHPGLNNWHNIYMLEGNYWSDYTGTDSDGDGIGDTEWPEIGFDAYPFMVETGWDIFTMEEEEMLNALFDPDSNRLAGYSTVRSDETCYIIIGMKQLFSERIDRQFCPPYTAHYQIKQIIYSFSGSFWYFDEVAYDEPGYIQYFYIKVQPNYFLELDLILGENSFYWIISFYNNGEFVELALYRTFNLV